MRATNGKSGGAGRLSGPKKLEDLEAEGKLAMDRLEDIANYMGDYRDIVDEYAVRETNEALAAVSVPIASLVGVILCKLTL